MATTPSRTARAHPAVRTDDVLACTFEQLEVRDGLIDGVAAVCKTWSSAWRRRCLGSYRMAALGIGPFDYAEYVSACPMAGVLVADYGKARLIEVLLVKGLMPVKTMLCQNISGPDGLAYCADGTAWVIARDVSCIVRVALSRPMPSIGPTIAPDSVAINASRSGSFSGPTVCPPTCGKFDE